MQDIISPSYLMKLVKMIQEAIWNEYKSYKEVRFYVDKWHEPITFFNPEENFKIYELEAEYLKEEKYIPDKI